MGNESPVYIKDLFEDNFLEKLVHSLLHCPEHYSCYKAIIYLKYMSINHNEGISLSEQCFGEIIDQRFDSVTNKMYFEEYLEQKVQNTFYIDIFVSKERTLQNYLSKQNEIVEIAPFASINIDKRELLSCAITLVASKIFESEIEQYKLNNEEVITGTIEAIRFNVIENILSLTLGYLEYYLSNITGEVSGVFEDFKSELLIKENTERIKKIKNNLDIEKCSANSKRKEFQNIVDSTEQSLFKAKRDRYNKRLSIIHGGSKPKVDLEKSGMVDLVLEYKSAVDEISNFKQQLRKLKIDYKQLKSKVDNDFVNEILGYIKENVTDDANKAAALYLIRKYNLNLRFKIESTESFVKKIKEYEKSCLTFVEPNRCQESVNGIWDLIEKLFWELVTLEKAENTENPILFKKSVISRIKKIFIEYFNSTEFRENQDLSSDSCT